MLWNRGPSAFPGGTPLPSTYWATERVAGMLYTVPWA